MSSPSRRWQESDRKLLSSIGLMLVDEIHLLTENPRGAVLEGLMSRSMLRQQEAAQGQPDPMRREPIGNLRIIGLSATAPNANDVAEWSDNSVSHIGAARSATLSSPCQSLPSRLCHAALFLLRHVRLRGRVYSFTDEHRPVPLKFHVYDYKVKKRQHGCNEAARQSCDVVVDPRSSQFALFLCAFARTCPTISSSRAASTSV